MNLPKGLLQDSSRRLADSSWRHVGSGPAVDLGRVLFEPLAEDIAVVDYLSHRGFVPDGCLKRLDKVGSACQGFLRTCLAQLAKCQPTILTFGTKGPCKT